MKHKAIPSRTAQNSNLTLERFHYDPHKDYSQHATATIGNTQMVCSHCQARNLDQSPLVFTAKMEK
jgi:hypothetical protein